MSYVDVVLDRPTDDPFTYRLTPETLLSANPGTLVEVPVGPKREYGVVVARRKRISTELRDKLRPIERVLSTGTWAPDRSIQLARALAAYTGESLGVSLFRILPPPAKRSLPEVTVPPARSQPGRVLHCYGGHQQRLDQYQKLIAKAQVAGRQTLLIAPVTRHQWLAEHLSHGNRRVTIATAELSPTQQRRLAADLASGASDVLIGSRHVVGWPAHALGLLIIDEPTNQSHQDDQRPYADSATIAALRHTIDGGHVVLGLAGPVPAAALREQRGLAQKIATVPPLGTLYFHSPSRLGALNPSVVTKIERILATGGHCAIIAPRHGIGGQVLCHDCDQLLSCPDCQHTLEPLVDGRTLRCPNCDHETTTWPSECPHCHGQQLQSWGIGEESVTRWLQHQHPELLKQGLVVSTEGIFETPLEWQLVFFLAADSPLSAPDLMRPVRYVHAIAEALATGAEVIVETRDSTQPLLRSLNSLPALKTLLLERSRAHLPPFTRTLTLRGPLKDKDRLKQLLSHEPISQQQRDRELTVTLHIPTPEFLLTQRRLRQQLGRAWTIMTDSVLEHAEPLHGMMRV